MTEHLFGKTAAAGAQMAKISLEASRVKEKVEDAVEEGMTAAKRAVEQAVEDGVTAAKRAAKRGRYAAEDLLDETSHRVKRNPLRAVTISFWAGFGLGAIVIWMGSRNRGA
jgi:ElaB/YqjD/DUF883 family membrane-anchored ribosome-binding protein